MAMHLKVVISVEGLSRKDVESIVDALSPDNISGEKVSMDFRFNDGGLEYIVEGDLSSVAASINDVLRCMKPVLNIVCRRHG